MWYPETETPSRAASRKLELLVSQIAYAAFPLKNSFVPKEPDTSAAYLAEMKRRESELRAAIAAVQAFPGNNKYADGIERTLNAIRC